ncbi:hypothetical protein [Legionella pneumophila]|nr:hypothetical protein [Legionella pneumophila]
MPALPVGTALAATVHIYLTPRQGAARIAGAAVAALLDLATV